MKKLDLKTILEGILFASKEPLSIEVIKKMFSEEERPSIGELRQTLLTLQMEYQTRGMELVEVASGYRFQLAASVVPFLAKSLEEKPARYSRALLETLALIAYRQPITRGEIEAIRGVAVSSHIIRTLEEHEWIRVVGHKELPGKPALYATSKYFLDHFGLKTLQELPPLGTLQPLDGFVSEALALQEGEKVEEEQEKVQPCEAIECE